MPKRERVPFSYDPALKPWERQPGEPKQAHLYFLLGIGMPARQRSVKKVSEEAGISALRCYQYSSLYEWSDRWREWDAVRVGDWLADIATDRMAVSYEAAEQLKHMQELSGQWLVQAREQPGTLPPIEFIRLMNTQVAMFKTIYGAAPEVHHHTGPGGGPLVTVDFSELDQLTPEEVAARVKQLTGQDLPPDLAPSGNGGP